MNGLHLYTVAETAEILRVGRTTLYGLIRSGRLKTVKIGASRRVPASAVEAFLADADV